MSRTGLTAMMMGPLEVKRIPVETEQGPVDGVWMEGVSQWMLGENERS